MLSNVRLAAIRTQLAAPAGWGCEKECGMDAVEELLNEREELVANVECLLAKREILLNEVKWLRCQIRRALLELGVPQPDYPAPVANAVAILKRGTIEGVGEGAVASKEVGNGAE